MINAEQILLLISTTLFLAYVAGAISHRTRIPDIVWLLGFGMLIGPALHIVDESLYGGIFDLMLLVTLTMFSFSTGVSINAQQLAGQAGKAFSLAAASFLSITFVTGGFLHFLYPEVFGVLEGLLLGAMVGGMSGVSVSSLLTAVRSGFKDIGEAGILLQLESAIGDPIRVVGVLALIEVIAYKGAPVNAVRNVLRLLAASVAIGLFCGLVWGELLSRLRDRPLNYMMTIALLFPVFVLAEYVGGGGGGPIAVFIVGFVLMNYGYVTRGLGLSRRARVDRKRLRDYHDELTFLMKSLFFVYLGLIMSPTWTSLEVSLVVSVLIIVVRFLVVTVVGTALGLGDEELFITRVIYIQGAATLVLSQLPSKYDAGGLFFADPDLFTTLCIPIVLLSILYNSIVSPMVAKDHIEWDEEEGEAPQEEPVPRSEE